jgi:hypothetical protein
MAVAADLREGAGRMTPDEKAARDADKLAEILRCEQITLKLCRKSGDVEGYRWRAPHASWRDQTRLTSHRAPPLPFHSFVHRGAGTCRVCGQPVYDGGRWKQKAGQKPSSRLTWHSVCTTTYFVMTKPNDYRDLLIRRQAGVCALSGDLIDVPFREDAVDVDHRVPLYRVARDHADEPWFRLIRFWMTGNLFAVTRAAHLIKCADEARERAGRRPAAAGQPGLRL